MASESDDSSYSSSSSSESQTRPNRWRGHISTWQSLTEQERDLATSLDLLRNQDLGVHLYNSFALKKRAHKLDLQAGKGVPKDDEDEKREWKPAKTWTAWPLPPDRVPRVGERIGPADPNDVHTFKRREAVRPSRELEDIMVGVTLKHAKERFESREGFSIREDVEDQSMNQSSLRKS